MADGQGRECCGGDLWMRMISGGRTHGGGGLAVRIGGCFITELSQRNEWRSHKMTMSDCQDENVSQAAWNRFRETPVSIADEVETLRDRFAMVALHAQMSCARPWWMSAGDAYVIADAMMEARKK